MKRAGAHATVLLWCVTVAIAAAQQAPSRDQAGRGAPAPAGTARVGGVVMDTQSPARPVPRVIVTLTGAELLGGRTAISDDQGRFVFDRLPAGRFNLAGTKPAYLPASYGSPRPGKPGIPVQVAAGQQVSNLQLVIAHGAAVSGTIRDPGGEPMPNVAVHAFRTPRPGGSVMLQIAGTGTTDDRGVYRIYGLAPGEYVVATATRIGSAAAGTNDLTGLTSAQIDSALRELQQRTGRASGSPAPALSVPAATASYSYAPVFYPGTTSALSATRVTLGVGDDRGDLDFVMQFTRMATVEGSVRAADGSVPTTQFVVKVEGLQMPSLLGSVPTFSSQVGPNGRTFKYTNVVPGRYRIIAQTMSPVVSYAFTDVEVRGDDVSGLTLVLQPAASMSGRIVFDGTTLQRPEASALRVLLLQTNGLGTATAGTTRLSNFYVQPAVIGDDGLFEINGIYPEAYRLTATVQSPAGWWLKSAMVNGRDILDYGFEVTSITDSRDAVLTFSDRHTQLSGRLETAGGRAAAAYFIAVFPTARELWRPAARRIGLTRADADGTWIVKDLPPGEYFIAALTDIDSVEALDVRVLEALAAAAVKATLADGEQKTQNLRIGGG